MTQFAFNLVMQNGLKWHCIMGKTICLRVKGQVVKETDPNSVVCIPVHFICCMSHHRMLRRGPEMRFQSQHLFFFFFSHQWADWNLTLVPTQAADKDWIGVLNTRKWMFSWFEKKGFLTKGLSKWERSLSLISSSANPLWVQPEP